MLDRSSHLVQVHVFRKKTPVSHEYLLLKRSKTDPQYSGIWQVVTGTRERDETATETAIREVKEETGLSPLSLTVIPYQAFFYNPTTDSTERVPVFAFEVLPSSVVQLSEEHEAYQWFPYELAHTKLALPAHVESLEILENILLGKD